MLPFSNAFYRGLTDLISPSWLKLFNASEFNQVSSFSQCVEMVFLKFTAGHFYDKILHCVIVCCISIEVAI